MLCKIILLLSVGFCITQTLALRQHVVANSLVISTTTETSKEGSKDVEPEPTVPQIYSMHVDSKVSNRFAHTVVTSKVRNLGQQAQEATFSIILPESAFISGFTMEVEGKNYTAHVKEKEAAKQEYDEGVRRGQAAAHVSTSARDSNRFTVSVNVQGQSKAAFYLDYEELLKRTNGHYELVINLHPGQPVKDLAVEVTIAENRPITSLAAPPIRSGNEITPEKEELDPRADINFVNSTYGVVKFSPNIERQKQLARGLGTNSDEGLSGQFLVRYDVQRDPNGGEVLVNDGYFVHFFAPSDLRPLPKHVVFVLDTSSSMYHPKLGQLKVAMLSILNELKEDDLFNLVEFNTLVKIWNLETPENSSTFPSDNSYSWNRETNESITDSVLPQAYPANAENIKKAKNAINSFRARGSTNIYDALRISLRLVELTKTNSKESPAQPLIMFLTDGDPTASITNTDTITSRITEMNKVTSNAAVFTLSFGSGVDKLFLQKLSSSNNGFSRHIYEAADASLQLRDFYKQISSPLLTNVTFKYTEEAEKITKSNFPILFDGSEFVISGAINGTFIHPPQVHGRGRKGPILLTPLVQTPATNLERLWGYLTIQQLLEQEKTAENAEEVKLKALGLALKYSFVTKVSSLVVVKPNDTSSINTEAADKKPQFRGSSRMMSGQRSRISHSFVIPRLGYARPRYGAPHHLTTSYAPPAPPAYAAARHPIAFDDELSSATNPSHKYVLMSSTYSNGNIQSIPRRLAIVKSIPITVTTNVSTTDNLLVILPWLKDILNENGTISSPPGNFKLGLNETISSDIICNKTPTNTAGHCKLLKDCPVVHSLLQTLSDFITHFCNINEYAGVCCPDSS